jgi:hypothetical protein
VDLNIDPNDSGLSLDAVPLVLQNAWAVRAIAGSGNTVQLDIAIDTATLTGPNGSAIEMSDPTVDDGTSSGVQIQFAPEGLFSPVLGDIGLVLDLRNASVSGNYSGGTYALTAEAP